MTRSLLKNIGIVGGGPAGLMAASTLAQNPHLRITLFEKTAGIGRKLLIAGSSGLNISHDLPPSSMAAFYEGAIPCTWDALLQAFSPDDWHAFVEKIGFGVFTGTSRRTFLDEKKAADFVGAWKKSLTEKGVTFSPRSEVVGWNSTIPLRLQFADASSASLDHVIFAVGGGSWEMASKPAQWPDLFRQQNLQVVPFQSANCGFEVDWKDDFLKEAARSPLKNVVLKTSRGSKKGEVLLTEYGVEGTPVYFVGTEGKATLDLKPDETVEKTLQRLQGVKENLSPLRRAKKVLNLGEAALSLLFHHAPATALGDLSSFASLIHAFPLDLQKPRPLSESISSRGGLSLDEIDSNFRLKKEPRIQCIGEMLDWHAPTGGFLIQACVSQGAWAARSLLSQLFP